MGPTTNLTTAIQTATTAAESLTLYKLLLLRCHTPPPSAAVSLLRSATPSTLPSLHAHLLKSNLLSHAYVATTLLSRYPLSDAPALFQDIHEAARTVVTWNVVLTVHLRKGEVRRAMEVFEEMPERDVASWSAVIGGLMRTGECGRAMGFFRAMTWSSGCRPDGITIISLLSGFAVMGSMALLGKSLHAYCIRNELGMSIALGTAFVDMYGKNGCLTSAFSLFKRMPERNVASWTAMICGLALHGRGEEALTLFEKMKRAGVRPNEITFTSLLSACCHSGLVKEAKKAFSDMTNEFGLQPSIHHYGCFVDVLGKAGYLEEALEVIKSMKIEPNVVVWTSLLTACKVHKDYEFFAKKVREQIVKLVIVGSDDGGLYSLVADMYAMGRKWNDVEQVRELMEMRNVKKRRGSSFVGMEEQRFIKGVT